MQNGEVYGAWKILYKAEGKDMYHCICTKCNVVEKNIRGWILRNKPPTCECMNNNNFNSGIAVQKEIEQKYVNEPDYQKIGARAHNLYGKTFGYWKVLYYVGNRKWRCLCTCGCRTISDVYGYTLESGMSKGHNKSALIDERGNTYGKLKVLDYDKKLKKWRCICKCGNIHYASSKDLRNHDVKSCGKCYGGRDLKDMQFGEWHVIEYAGDLKWHCRCSCGTERDVLAQNLLNGRSSSCGCKSGEKRASSFRETMLDRYGETASSRVSCPREKWQVETVSNPEKLKAYIQLITNNNGRKPHIAELSEQLDTTYAALIKHINAYGLRDMCSFYDNFSLKEKELADYIKSIYDGEVETGCRDVLNGTELDIYLPELKLALEFDGVYWHSEDRKDRLYHINKSKACSNLGIQLIHIYEYEWDSNRGKIAGYLKDRICGNKIIYARNCSIYKLNNKQSDEFFEQNHLQGTVHGSFITLALVTEIDGVDTIVSAMSFGKPRFNNNFDYELLRFTNKTGLSIAGGASKLFKCFLDNTDTGDIISYCNIDKFNGSIYKSLGFELDHIADPNYVWVKPDGSVLTRYQTMKTKLVQYGFGNKDMTEDEIMRSLKCYKLYDSGNYVFTYKRK